MSLWVHKPGRSGALHSVRIRLIQIAMRYGVGLHVPNLSSRVWNCYSGLRRRHLVPARLPYWYIQQYRPEQSSCGGFGLPAVPEGDVHERLESNRVHSLPSRHDNCAGKFSMRACCFVGEVCGNHEYPLTSF